MFHINRTEQFTIYYWTGSNWSTDREDAKLFQSRDEAKAEVKSAQIEYTVRINEN